jgi:hypothetical protein
VPKPSIAIWSLLRSSRAAVKRDLRLPVVAREYLAIA